ncbi:MAG: heme-binding protein, partial [Planctomycetes bacterium]|nr:heme-binding protein [Planctomycetota bacterium]
TVWIGAVENSTDVRKLTTTKLEHAERDLNSLTHGGPPRWPQRLETQPMIGADDGPFAVDVLTHPLVNPWHAQMRLTGLDFLPDGDQAAVCSWDGDVWLVSGLSKSPGPLSWQRIASGLFQPLGLKIIQGRIFVTCRDQIVILNDLNGDGETDFYECFNSDHQVTAHFHEFAMGLQTDAAGNLYYAKAACHARPALVPQHGTLLRVSPDGLKTDILARGFRAPNGVCLNPDGTFFMTDQEGHWLPKNRINRVVPGKFYGNMMGAGAPRDSSDKAMEQPVCWITNAFDRSPAEMLWVDSKAWGPLQGSLLNLSYGYGKVFIVPHEEMDGQWQGGMCELPMPMLPTGIIRGRFHPRDGQLYACGMYAWAGDRTSPGGLYRIRATGKPAYVPTGLKARSGHLEITLSNPLDTASVSEVKNYAVRVWSLKRTASYGSQHYDEHALEVTGTKLAPDGRTIVLAIPNLAPTWCMEIKYVVKGTDGKPVTGKIHNTIYKLGP